MAAPLRDRFGFVGQLDLYERDELRQIVDALGRTSRASVCCGDAAGVIAQRSRGTPRIANRLLRRVRDVASVGGHDAVDDRLAADALDLFGVDEHGLDKIDRRILGLLCGQFAQLPVGLTTLSHASGEEPATIEDAYEPYLLREGFLIRTPRGRVATDKGLRPPWVCAPGAEDWSRASPPSD